MNSKLESVVKTPMSARCRKILAALVYTNSIKIMTRKLNKEAQHEPARKITQHGHPTIANREGESHLNGAEVDRN